MSRGRKWLLGPLIIKTGARSLATEKSLKPHFLKNYGNSQVHAMGLQKIIHYVYIYYISEHYVNKLEALVLDTTSSGEGGSYSCGYQQSLYVCIKYIEQQHLGHTGYLFVRHVSVFGKQRAHRKENTTHNHYPGKNTKHSGNTVGNGLKTLPTTLQQCLDAAPGFDSNAKVLWRRARQRSLTLNC